MAPYALVLALVRRHLDPPGISVPLVFGHLWLTRGATGNGPPGSWFKRARTLRTPARPLCLAAIARLTGAPMTSRIQPE